MTDVEITGEGIVLLPTTESFNLTFANNPEEVVLAHESGLHNKNMS